MIQLLSKKYSQAIAFFFVLAFSMSIAFPAYAGGHVVNNGHTYEVGDVFIQWIKQGYRNRPIGNVKKTQLARPIKQDVYQGRFIGGPSQPEMTSFKSVSTDNMVNLFTGDFSYNIPLLDVGGYPVNIYYDGAVGLEQEASWVGLGWNINPGSISRNMRGIPDDFDGTEIMTESQNVKPNITWGGRAGADFELAGIKNLISGNIGVSLGASYNNYLGPALDVGVKGGINFNIGSKIYGEKEALTDTVHGLSLGASGSLNLSSRDGLTVSASASLTKRLFSQNHLFGFGLSVGSSYNSRVGIKDLQLSGQISESVYKAKDPCIENQKPQSVSTGDNLFGTTISFARPSYVPTIRMPMTNRAWSGHLQVGAGLYGAHPNLELEVYNQTSKITTTQQLKPMFGYMYYQNAANNDDAVMDFTRLGDREVTATTPIISAPQYTYDVFSIQGEGTGGTVRAYRTDMGYVKDNNTKSTDGSTSGGLDIGPLGHWGGNLNIIKTPSTISKWNIGNKLDNGFNFQQGKDLHELVYLRNPGESSVLDGHAYDKIGGTDLVRYQIGGDASSPTVEPLLLHYTKEAKVKYDNQPNPNPVVTNIVTAASPSSKVKRSQVITFLTADEATRAGLDKTINNYDPSNALSYNTQQNYFYLNPSQIARSGGYRLGHHISQVNVTEADGKRYIYGIPVYNITQTDFTFSVKQTMPNPDASKVDLGADANNLMSPNSRFTSSDNGEGVDGYFQSTTTPAYAHSFLLSGLLSPDYVDVTGNGITEDDLGGAVKFNYSLYMNGSEGHKWRTPLSNLHEANFNAGNRTEIKDDKGIVSYGEREQWYLHSIESKTMIAIFTLANRDDGKGAKDEFGEMNTGDNTIKCLEKIDLYNKADLRLHGLTGDGKARPIKTVHFVYSYRLCYGTPDNTGIHDKNNQKGGKLTLESVYFTFNGQERTAAGEAAKTRYKFSYANTDLDNPDYAQNATDRWGTYKPATNNSAGTYNPANLPNKDYPYSLQVSEKATLNNINTFAGAWALKKILLPSGGQIEVTYESDDYSYVQNKPAAQMMQVAGFGRANTSYPDHVSPNLYDFTSASGGTPVDNFYVFINVDKPCTTKEDALRQYFTGYTKLSQIAFRYAVLMPKGEEYITSYAHIAPVKLGDVETDELEVGPTSNPNVIWLKLKDVDGYGPLSVTALEYLREQLPGQAYPGYDMSDPGEGQFQKILSMISDMIWGGLGTAFRTPMKFFRAHNQSFAQSVSSDGNSLKCFVRLTNPSGVKNSDGTTDAFGIYGVKYGGGSRVKQIILKDNWKKMTGEGQYTSIYGQVYDYTATETLGDNTIRIISSGVASYEPSIGAEENPFTGVAEYENRLPWGPASYGSVELPTLDAFFPAPVVGYSKVTVRSLADVDASAANKKTKSGIGRQVTEFYTAKDYPVYYNYTPIDKNSDVSEHDASLLAFFHKTAFDYRTLSQGFVIATNDMHGKLKRQSSYSALKDDLLINFTENHYTNIGVNDLNDQFDFVDGNNTGKIFAGNMGVDIELMTDTREFSVSSEGLEVQAQLDLFPVVLPFWLPFIWPVSSESENIYRAVTATKVINYHSVVDKVMVMDKGSKVTTQNLLRDAETGEVIVNQTGNEFNQPIYTTTYPAYWAYSGMGPAYKNIDDIYYNVDFSNGVISSTNGGSSNGTHVSTSLFESGDELLIFSTSLPVDGCDAKPEIVSPDISTIGPDGKIATQRVDIIWAVNTNKNTSSLTDHSPNPPFIFIDADGKPYTRANTNFRIIRSGKRNLLGAHLQAITNMLVSPIAGSGNNRSLVIDYNHNVVNASAIEYKEKWQTDPDELKGFLKAATTCDDDQPSCEVNNPDFYWEKSINPYRKGLLGNFRPYRNFVYYGNRAEQDITNSSTPSTLSTNLPKNGFFDNAFNLYWSYGTTNSLTPDVSANSKWVFQSRTTRENDRGMELENVDALNIYTAAQYGFNKTLPVAITNNAAYGQAVYEGFEDNSYNNSMNNSTFYNCLSGKYFELTSIGNDLIKSSDDVGFNAHTGRYMLKIPNGATLSKTFLVANSLSTDFDITFGQDIQKTLSDPNTGNAEFPSLPPGPEFLSPLQYPIGANPNASFGHSHVEITMDFNAKGAAYSYGSTFGFYIEIKADGLYNFREELASTDRDNSTVAHYHNGIKAEIHKDNEFGLLMGNPIELEQIETSPTDLVSSLVSIPLCKGIYYVKGTAYQAYPQTGNSDNSYNKYFWDCLNCNSPDYKTLNTTDGCHITLPVSGNADKLNPVFKIPEAKQMVFSAWVHEDGGNTNSATYGNNHIQLAFARETSVNGSISSSPVAQTVYNSAGQPTTTTQVTVDLNPAGPVIDGWRRYEGYFAAPNGANRLNLNFVNNGTSNIYFDDIRIHPFNANMKSYVYDPVNQRLVAQLDANNYASFYEYDEEGTLIRTKAETVEGIKTINETRSAKQRSILDLQ